MLRYEFIPNYNCNILLTIIDEWSKRLSLELDHAEVPRCIAFQP